jgi:hypothetical protein
MKSPRNSIDVAHFAPNQALQPTAGRRITLLFGMNQLPILGKLVLASGG